MKRQVVILAGGLGTRLRPITEKTPKPMVPVLEKPFLHWQLMDLKRQGYKRVLILTAYLGEQIEAYFGSGAKYGMQITYSREPQPLGTGGALRFALEKLENEFFILNGDSFLRAPLDEMALAFHKGTFSAMISSYESGQAGSDMPVVPNLDCLGDRVIRYEKDAGTTKGFRQIDSGIYILRRSVVAERPRVKLAGQPEAAAAEHPKDRIAVTGPEEVFALADLWPALIANDGLGAFAVAERFYDIGTPERLSEFETALAQWQRAGGSCDYFTHTIQN